MTEALWRFASVTCLRSLFLNGLRHPHPDVLENLCRLPRTSPGRPCPGRWTAGAQPDPHKRLPAILSTTVEFAHRLRVDAVASDSAWPRLDGCAATATSQRDDRALCRRHVAGR